MGDARDRISAGSGGNAGYNDLYRETVGNHDTLGDVTNDIGSL